MENNDLKNVDNLFELQINNEQAFAKKYYLKEQKLALKSTALNLFVINLKAFFKEVFPYIKEDDYENIAKDICFRFSSILKMNIPTFTGSLYRWFLKEPLEVNPDYGNATPQERNLLLIEIKRKNYEIIREACDSAVILLNWLNKHNYVMCVDNRILLWSPTPKLPTVVIDNSEYYYPLPLIIKPKKITNNFLSGYYTANLKNQYVVTNVSHFDDTDKCLDHINRMNSVQLKIDLRIALNVSNAWKCFAGVKDYSQYTQQIKAFNQYNESVLTIAKSLTFIQAISKGIYFTHQYDSRGRIYCRGYHITYQGNDWNKASILFVKGQIVKDEVIS